MFSVQRTALKRKVASRIAVEAVEGVVQIHVPRLKLNNHTIGDPNEIAVEERGREGEGEEEGAVGGRDPEAQGEDGQGDERDRRSPPPMDIEEDLVVQTSVENLMDWTHLNLTLYSY